MTPAEEEARMVRPGALGELAPDPDNANRGSARGHAMLEDSLKRYGAGRSVVVDKHGVVIGGNKTVDAAKRAGLTRTVVVPTDGETLVVVQRTDLDLATDPRAKELALADNRVQEVSLDWDPAVLKRLAAQGLDLTQFWTQDELARVVGGFTGSPTPADLTHLDALVAKWESARGGRWRIPSHAGRGRAHRLVCGDAMDAAMVADLCAGVRPVLFATDPPYGVQYTGANRPHASSGEKDWGALYHEETAAEFTTDYAGFLRTVFTAALPVLDARAPWYVWHADPRGPVIAQVWAELGVLTHQQLIWVKPQAFIGQCIWSHQHEPCLLGWRRGHRPPSHNDEGLSTSTVWTVDWEDHHPRHDAEALHPTRKPIELFARPLRKHTVVGDVCYEPFAGSGTQLLAAEQTGRLCVALELEPRFVAGILERCAAAGLVPERLDAGAAW